jgi:hypothetical protein
MTDEQLLAALEAGRFELSSSGAQTPTHQPSQPAPSQHAPQPASQFPVTNERNQEAQRAQPTAQPSRQKKEAVPRQAAGQPDRHLGWGRQQRAIKGTDSQAQPGTSSQKQPRGEQPAEEAPQAQQPEATQIQPADEKKTHQSRRKAFTHYMARKFRRGE